MKKNILVWKILLLLTGIPLIFQLYSYSPVSIQLFVHSNSTYFIPFFVGIIGLHLLSFLSCFWLVKSAGWEPVELSYTLSYRQTVWMLAVYLLIATGICLTIEWVLWNSPPDPVKLKKIGDFFPKTTSQRILFVFVALSAGFCEEYVFRGFGIRGLEKAGLPLWLAFLITSVCFNFIHGAVVLKKFIFYFVPSLIFGLLFIWTKRLEIPMIIHALIDLTALLMIFRVFD